MNTMTTEQTGFWKRKLAAYLHDPPSKALDIKTHGERSDQAFRAAGFQGDEIGKYFRHADHTGAAVDRIPFPKSLPAGTRCAFDGKRNAFLHPLGNRQSDAPLKYEFHKEFPSAELAIEGEQSVQPVLSPESLGNFEDEEQQWRARFFTHWRQWRQFAVEKDYRLAFLPADTRIPDHSIWTHMQVVSALTGCVHTPAGCVHNKQWGPAFLKFQLGPVQDFIAAARSTRDLWSGSYLLSWLMAAGLKRLSEQTGPDNVIYPNLQGQPLFDLHWRDDLWKKAAIGGKSVWDSFHYSAEDLLTPNLPNVFVAVVPDQRGNDLGKAVAEAIKEEWRWIADAVWHACEGAGLCDDEGALTKERRKKRYDHQAEQFLSLSWQVTPWPATVNEALDLAKGFAEKMPAFEAAQRVRAVVDMPTVKMPEDHRDERYYVVKGNGRKDELNNVGLAWSIMLALNSWQLDAVRQARQFAAVGEGQWRTGAFCNKDSLTGREEAVAGGRVWLERCKKTNAALGALFKHDDWMGAASLIKRVWHLAYLKDTWKLDAGGGKFGMPNTYRMAAHEPFANSDDAPPAEEIPTAEKYFAVLALDGDEIGKWVSGDKTPPFRTQLADYMDHGQKERHGILEYFTRESNPDGKGRLKDRFNDFLAARRPLFASYHLQFSEALSNFARFCARPIVESFDGRLIYAGGDDVVAMLPADSALACAQCLRLAFTGSPGLKDFLSTHAKLLHQQHEEKQRRTNEASGTPHYMNLASQEGLMDCEQTGFVRRLDLKDQNGIPIPFLVPGPAADCSVGIAIAHFKAPLQDVVRAAKSAENRAKNKLGRSAVAVTLMKRSGEIIEWGCQWESGGLDAYAKMVEGQRDEIVSAKFPHRIIELVDGYQSDPIIELVDGHQSDPPDKMGGLKMALEFAKVAQTVLAREIGVAAARQQGKRYESSKAGEIASTVEAYLSKIQDTDKKVAALIGLCETVAFANRT